MSLETLTQSEQSLVWEQGFMTSAHPQASRLLSVIEALKTSGYDLATVLSIVKSLQYGPYAAAQSLPKHFSVINNKYLSVPLIDDGGQNYRSYIFDIDVMNAPVLTTPPTERKLMALTFWL